MENQRPTLKNKLGFALGHVMNDMCASMWFTYLLLYFHKVIEFNNIYSGVLLFIGKYFHDFKSYLSLKFCTFFPTKNALVL